MELKFEDILNDLGNKIYSPAYVFHGEEPYFIDVLINHIEQDILEDTEKEFNQVVVYGREVTPRDITDIARRFPMMGNYQVVIVKEAQAIKDLEELEIYFDAPLDTTILAIGYKYKKLDKRKSFYKKLNKRKDVVLFESKKLRDYEIPGWIEKSAKKMGFKINPVATELLAEHLGNDLGKISNELNKLAINLAEGSLITEEEIEKNIGISKDFNIFELQKALRQRNALKAQQIVNYFEANPKEHPLQMISVMLHNYFLKVFLYHHISNRKPNEIAAELGVNPFFVNDYKYAANVFSPQKIKSIISQIRTLDLKSKGVGSNDAASYGDLKELIYKIIH